MRRLVWVAVGAAGGIIVYRRAQRAMADAKERGVVLSAQQVGLSAASAVVGARALATQAGNWSPSPLPKPGAAAARALQRGTKAAPKKQADPDRQGE